MLLAEERHRGAGFIPTLFVGADEMVYSLAMQPLITCSEFVTGAIRVTISLLVVAHNRTKLMASTALGFLRI